MSDTLQIDDKSTTSVLAHYGVTAEQLAETKAKYAALTCDTKEGFLATTKARAEVREIRYAIEHKRKELKEDSLKWGRKVDAAAKDLTRLVLEIEDPLDAKIKEVEQAEALAKKAAEDAERLALEEQMRQARLEEERLLRLAREEEEARLKAIRDQEEAALAKKRADLLEQQRLADEQRERDRINRETQERLDKQRRDEEEAKLQAERDRLASIAKADEEKRMRIVEEQRAEEARLVEMRERLAADIRQAEEAKRRREQEVEHARLEAIRLEDERVTAAARAQQEAIEAKARAEQEEADRKALEAEEAEIKRVRLERVEAMKPDAAKVATFAEKIRALNPPKVKSSEAAEVLYKTVADLEEVAVDLERRWKTWPVAENPEIAALQHENKLLRDLARQHEVDRETKEYYERLLTDIGRSIGCGHIDDRLPGCVDQKLDELEDRLTLADNAGVKVTTALSEQLAEVEYLQGIIDTIQTWANRARNASVLGIIAGARRRKGK